MESDREKLSQAAKGSQIVESQTKPNDHSTLEAAEQSIAEFKDLYEYQIKINDSLNDQNSELNEQIEKVNGQIKVLQEQNEALKHSVGAFENKKNKAGKSAAKEEVKTPEDSQHKDLLLEQAQEQLNKMKEEMERLSSEKVKLDESRDELGVEMQGLKDQLEDKVKLVESKEEEIKQLNEMIAKQANG